MQTLYLSTGFKASLRTVAAADFLSCPGALLHDKCYWSYAAGDRFPGNSWERSSGSLDGQLRLGLHSPLIGPPTIRRSFWNR